MNRHLVAEVSHADTGIRHAIFADDAKALTFRSISPAIPSLDIPPGQIERPIGQEEALEKLRRWRDGVASGQLRPDAIAPQAMLAIFNVFSLEEVGGEALAE